MYKFKVSLLFILLLITGGLFAQINETVNVELVEIYVSALDSENRPVEDLTQDDFILKEDRAQHSLTYFTRLTDPGSRIPLTIAFLLDTSGSMSKELRKSTRIDVAKNFASSFLREVTSDDQVQILAFDNIFRALTPMTSDLRNIESALANVEIDKMGSPGSGVLASVHLTVEQMKKYFGRRIMILCSDGFNNIPGPDPEALVEELRRNDVTVISLVTGEPKQTTRPEMFQVDSPSGDFAVLNVEQQKNTQAKQAKKLMTKLAEETGGYVFFAEDDSDLNPTLRKIDAVIRSQYALSYKPGAGAKKGWRTVEVRCKRKGVKLRYRQGYFSD